MTLSASPTTGPLVIDGLNCAELTRAQILRTLAGGVSAMNYTVLRPPAGLEAALLQIAAAQRTIAAMSDIATVVTTVAEIEQAHADGRFGIILGAQNSVMVETDVRLLETFRALGLRILQPTYNEQNAFGYGAPFTGDEDRGMTERGREWLCAMEELGLLVDLSHCGHRTSADYIAAARKPLVFSHANAYALCPSPRNKPDALIRAIAANGGLIGALTWSPVVRFDARPTLDDFANHILHLVNIGGIDHVGFASDLPEGREDDAAEWEALWGRTGKYPKVTSVMGEWYRHGDHMMLGMESMSKTSQVWDKLKARGLGENDLDKLMSGNWMRVLKDVWKD